MNILRAILAELAGLFIDDGALALALVLWCGGVWLAGLVLPGMLSGAALLAGCAAILLLNLRRASAGLR